MSDGLPDGSPPEQPGAGQPGRFHPEGQPQPWPQERRPTPPPFDHRAPSGPQTEGLAIAVLVLSVVSWVLCPIVPAIAALVLAPKARRLIAQSGGRLTGESLVKVGSVVSWVNICVVGALILVVLLISIMSTSNTHEDTFREVWLWVAPPS